jgi:hypothetical protein
MPGASAHPFEGFALPAAGPRVIHPDRRSKPS